MSLSITRVYLLFGMHVRLGERGARRARTRTPDAVLIVYYQPGIVLLEVHHVHLPAQGVLRMGISFNWGTRGWEMLVPPAWQRDVTPEDRAVLAELVADLFDAAPALDNTSQRRLRQRVLRYLDAGVHTPALDAAVA